MVEEVHKTARDLLGPSTVADEASTACPLSLVRSGVVDGNGHGSDNGVVGGVDADADAYIHLACRKRETSRHPGRLETCVRECVKHSHAYSLVSRPGPARCIFGYLSTVIKRGACFAIT